MTPEVEEAIAELRAQFPNVAILVGPDKDGGACVIVERVELGPPYEQAETWVGFHITQACPYADVYPHFVRADLSRIDKVKLGEAITPGQVFPQPGVVLNSTVPSRSAIQVSRRSNKRDPNSNLETPLLKLLKVMRWLKSR